MPGKIGKFEIQRTLGRGASCKVKLAFDTEMNRNVAVKIMNDNIDDKARALLLNEVKALELINHTNVVNQISYGVGTYEKISGTTREVSYVVLELASGGELFDFIAISGRFPEELARFYMK